MPNGQFQQIVRLAVAQQRSAWSRSNVSSITAGLQEADHVGHCGRRRAHLGEEPVHEDRLQLAKAVDPEDTLDVVGRVPGGVEDDDPVGGHQVDAQRAGAGGNEEQTSSGGEWRSHERK